MAEMVAKGLHQKPMFSSVDCEDARHVGLGLQVHES